MKEQIEALKKERSEQVLIKQNAHVRIIDINLKIRQLETLEKKMNAVLNNMKGNEISI